MPSDQPNREIRRLHAVVHGMVQGVGFRVACARKAIDLKLSGWVRNMSDGTVETTAEGPLPALNRYLLFLHEGPPAASVTKVDSLWQEPTGEFSNFRVVSRWG